jgi:uncharacterized protein YacL
LFEFLAFRVLTLLAFAASGFFLRPFQSAPLPAAAAGLVLGILVILAEIRIQRAPLKRLVGGAVGALAAGLIAVLSAFVLNQIHTLDPSTVQFCELALLIVSVYVGVSVGVRKGDLLNLAVMGIFGGETTSELAYKILDTSVIIDGRIADITATGFLDGVLVIPQFVLRELQLVADSSDSMKRNRGRRGLDVLQRMQKMAQADIRIVEDDFPQVREVDLKLIELAKVYEAKIVTNDFNLNKVAQLRGVEVLNINELANALKPIVLPGEIMRVFILKEGKEYNQGVAYLDDGTMVVVDNAKRMI